MILGDGSVCDFLQHVLGIEGDPEARIGHHDPIIGSVSHGDHFFPRDAFEPADLIQDPRLPFASMILPFNLPVSFPFLISSSLPKA